MQRQAQSRRKQLAVLVLAALACGASCIAGAQAAAQGRSIDLRQTFRTRTPWRLVVTEGPPVKDAGDNDAPGALTLCLRAGASGSCVSAPVTMASASADPAYAWEPHYLLAAKPVFPGGPQAAPLLLVVTGSLYSGDGDRLLSTQLIAYDGEHDSFRRVYGRSVGHNNNQEIRFVTEGVLQGSVLSAEPQQRAPFGYWIEVEQPGPTGEYRQVLRFASATRYGDGNQLAVIDSEMPSIQRRLGLWKPGDALPLPGGRAGKACLKPALRQNELWCR